ncbi:MAG: hypothetical protein GEV09_26330 [Pseudonocardiaceae bacterium]|nr:hypothetical protein [Pseudonocardiaceae bacterium]
MRIDVVTIFPDYLTSLDVSLIGRARAGGLLDIRVHDLRGWTEDVHRSVDDTVWRGRPVPEPLLSGNHQLIADWRRQAALARTAERRPDLLGDR